MKIINNTALLHQKMKEHDFAHIFSTTTLPFLLTTYEKGELLNFRRNLAQSLVFVLEGRISIYNIHDNGNSYHVCTVQGPTMLGDVEFIQNNAPTFWVEALTPLLCIELPTDACKHQLLNDNTFLRYCLHSVTSKFSLYLTAEALSSSLDEKLMHYIQHDCNNQRLTGVQAAADHLHCSRRQLQRLLKKWCEEGRLVKTGKGVYELSTK